MDETLKAINKNYIQMEFDDIKTNNYILTGIINHLVEELKKDSLFSLLYERVFFGGSFYDGLKVGKPNEFDIDLVLKLPAKMCPSLSCPIPGFVVVELYKLDSYPNLNKLLDENDYLSSAKVMAWFQSILDKVLNSAYLKDLGYSITKCYGAPAATLRIASRPDNDVFYVDFVPSFKFSTSQLPDMYYNNWPDHPLTSEFLVIPKPLNSRSPCILRLSFQGQERLLLHQKGALKPAIRLLKLLRDRYDDDQLKSYFIKTVALTWLRKNTRNLENAKLSTIFMSLMQECIEALAAGNIAYYWHTEFNLLHNTSEAYTTDLANRWRKQLSKISLGDHQTILQIFRVNQSIFAQPNSSGDLATADTDSSVSTTTIVGVGLGVAALATGLMYMMRRNRDD